MGYLACMIRFLPLLCFLLLPEFALGQAIELSNEPGTSVSISREKGGNASPGKPYLIKEEAGLGSAMWRFKAGDSTGWANPAYNDQHWAAATSPNGQIRENKALWADGRGWFRLPIRAHKSVPGRPVSLIIEQFGRSEVYLDGKLLAKLTPLRIDSGGSQRITQSVPLLLTDTNRHMLAIRYAFRKDPVFFAELGEPAMNFSVRRTDEALTNHESSEEFGVAIDFLSVGIFGTLSLLHFLFFRVNRRQRINRTLFWAMLAFAATFLCDYLGDITPNLTLDSAAELTKMLGLCLGSGLLLWGVYQYLQIRAGWFFYTIAGFLTLDFLYRAVVGPLPDYTGGVAATLTFIDYIRLSWLGRKRKEADSRLPWRSLKLAFLCLVGVLLIIIIGVLANRILNLDFDLVIAPLFVLVFIALLSIPVGLSLSLVQDYARTYKTLNTKLQEVEQLSARTVVQEQEKQHLLARQNEMLERQVAERTAALDRSLTELRTTQDQLIQREKLASLGELTAGVAHEIQNPLNFVNNFSEVSVELLTELEAEQERPATERDTELEKEILGDIKQNISKISHHGQRAASIVRGMLQHSRASTGQREPADLNALADEYLRLAYHGIKRSEGRIPGASINDKLVEVSLVTQFDADLPAVSVVPQDMGRVLMNLFTNAFHAVQERTQTDTTGTYWPTVTVTTAQVSGRLQIRVHDNGTGIPDDIRGKVFQPFFTTKPTGKGTGLGLSLSYDIVTKGHGGTLTVRSEPGTFTEFTVEFPA